MDRHARRREQARSRTRSVLAEATNYYVYVLLTRTVVERNRTLALSRFYLVSNLCDVNAIVKEQHILRQIHSNLL